MFSTTVQQLISIAQSYGIKFKWATKAQLGKYSGEYCPTTKTVYILKGMDKKSTETMILHELSHALWDLSLPKGKRGRLKGMDIKTTLLTKVVLVLFYDKEEWKEESFAYYMQTQPQQLLQLFQAL